MGLFLIILIVVLLFCLASESLRPFLSSAIYLLFMPFDSEGKYKVPVANAVNKVGTAINKVTATPEDEKSEAERVEGGYRFFVLYAGTIVIELFASLIRSIPIFFVVGFIIWAFNLPEFFTRVMRLQDAEGFQYLLLWISDVFRTIGNWTEFLAILNILWSLWAYFGAPSGGLLTRWALGARQASRREADIYYNATENLKPSFPPKTLVHSSFWVIDSNAPNTYTIGRALYVTTRALHDNHFPALLAHEIGHRNQGDGSYLKALRNLVYPFMGHALTSSRNLRTADLKRGDVARAENDKGLLYTITEQVSALLFSVFFGGLGVLLMSPFFAMWFRTRDYQADAFVVKLNFGQMLLEHLEEFSQFDVAVPFWNLWTPYTELRVDNILKLMGM